MSRVFLVLLASLAASPVFAQSPAPAPAPAVPVTVSPSLAEAQLRLIVIDQTSAGIPTANVTLTPAVGAPITVITDERGVVNIPALPVGALKVRVEFSGFETYEGALTMRRGANNQTITMALGGLTDEVVVSESDNVGGETRGSAMVTTLTAAEIDALPDDPEDLQAYLEQLVGPDGATFYLNGFRGGRLPTKDEIRSIRIRQNSFSADGHESGNRSGVDIVTRPSTESFNGNLNLGLQNDAWNARNAQALTKTPEANRQVQVSFRGPIVKGKTAFSLTVNGQDRYTSNNLIAVDVSGNRIGQQVQVPTEQRNFNVGVEHALNASSTLRLTYQKSQSEGRNQGLGNFDLPERARETEGSGDLFRAQVQGVVGQGSLNEIRLQFNRNKSTTSSLIAAPAIIVQDAFSRGGAGVTNLSDAQTFELADNFDFTPHPNHQMRVGLLLEGGRYEQFDETNPAGRTVYASLDDFAIDRRLQFTQRLGSIDTSFTQFQFGFYWQDEIRVNNRLTVGVGLRNEMQSHVHDTLNLMPRVGFTYSPATNTSIRGGYGIYYDWYDSSLYEQTLRLNGVAQREIQINYEYELDEFGNPILDGNGKAILLASPQPLNVNSPTNKTVASPDLSLPYVHQASLGLQQQLLPNVNFQVTYQRQEGRSQLRGIDINTPVFNAETGLMARPQSEFGIVTEIQSTGRFVSDRLTMQTRFQLPQQRGMLQLAYQLGHATGDSSGATSLPSNSLDPGADWGPQGQDIRHQGQIGGMVRLPFDVRLQGNLQFRSAPAYNLTTGADDNGDGVINDRPEGVSRNSLRGDSTWNITQFTFNKSIGFGGARTGDAGSGQPQGNSGGGNRGGNQQGFGGGGFQGGGRNNNNFNNNSNTRFQVQFSVRAQNPLNRVVRQGYTGNMRSPYFMTATGVQNARRIEFETSFRF